MFAGRSSTDGAHVCAKRFAQPLLPPPNGSSTHVQLTPSVEDAACVVYQAVPVEYAYHVPLLARNTKGSGKSSCLPLSNTVGAYAPPGAGPAGASNETSAASVAAPASGCPSGRSISGASRAS